MSTMVRNLVVGGSMFLLFYVGCSNDEETSDEDGTSTTAASTGPTSTGTMGTTTGSAVSTTAPASSSTGGGMVYECNPITNEPCGAGQACDFSNENKFVCFAPPNDSGICEPCDNGAGPFCQGTMNCYGGDGICRRYCCDDGDCGPSLTCDKTLFAQAGITDVGVCMGDIGAGGAGGGAGGSGGGSGIPGCGDVPAVAPSNGSCVPFP